MGLFHFSFECFILVIRRKTSRRGSGDFPHLDIHQRGPQSTQCVSKEPSQTGLAFLQGGCMAVEQSPGKVKGGPPVVLNIQTYGTADEVAFTVQRYDTIGDSLQAWAAKEGFYAVKRVLYGGLDLNLSDSWNDGDAEDIQDEASQRPVRSLIIFFYICKTAKEKKEKRKKSHRSCPTGHHHGRRLHIPGRVVQGKPPDLSS